MRLDVHLHVEFTGPLHVVHTDEEPGVSGHIAQLKDLIMALSAKLQAAVDAANAAIAKENTELDAIAAALANQAAVSGAAVATALAKVGVDEDTAADLITSATNSVQEHIDSVFQSIGVTPPSTVTGGQGDETISAGDGSDTLTGGQGEDTTSTGGDTTTDTTTGGQGTDTLDGGQGADSISTGGEETTAAPDLSVTSGALSDGVVGQTYTANLDIEGGTAPYNVSASPQSDNGVSIGTDGSVSGTPTTAGTSTFAVVVTDSSSPPKVESGTVTLTVADAPA